MPTKHLFFDRRQLSQPAERWSLAIILAGIFVFYVATLRAGHAWGDDFAMYIHHAVNLASGRAYGDTGYIFNAQVPLLGPPVYPPILPLILAPVYRLKGLDLRAMKIVLVGFAVLELFLLYLIARRYLPHWWACALLLLLGLNPQAWEDKENIGSDGLFRVFVFLVLYLVPRIYETSDSPPLYWAPFVGILIYLAYGTRNLGLVLIGFILVYDLLQQVRRRSWFPGPFAMVACAIAVALAAGQAIALHTTEGFKGLFLLSPNWYIHNATAYARALADFWANHFSSGLLYLIYGGATLLLIIGLITVEVGHITPIAIFGGLYLIPIVSYSLSGVYRLLLPIIPIYLIYVLAGLREVSGRVPAYIRKPILVAAALSVVVTYSGAFAHETWGPFREGLGDPQFISAVKFIREQTPVDSRIIFRKPRLLTLETGRAAAIYPFSQDPASIETFVRQIGATYILLAEVDDDGFETERDYLRPFLAATGDEWHLIKRIGPYELFERQDK